MTLRFAIVGCGRIAQRHAVHIKDRGELVAVCDVEPARAEMLATEYDCQQYTDIDSLLASEVEIDVLVVCTPNGLHAEHAIKALGAGCHVLCEKPMALSTHDCGAMITAAERSNRRLFVVKQNRYNPPVIAVKGAIDEGLLGKVFSLQLNCFWNRNSDYYKDSWKGTLDLDGGTLFTQFSHFVDLVYWMVGDVQEVSAFTVNAAHPDVEFEDSGVAILRFQNGAIGTVNFTVNSWARNMEGSLTVFAERGTVKIGGQYLNVLEYQEVEGRSLEVLSEAARANDYGTYQGSMSNHDKVYDNLLDVILSGGSVLTSSFEALKTVELIEKIYNAGRSAVVLPGYSAASINPR